MPDQVLAPHSWPHSPGSDSPLSLVVRKEEQRLSDYGSYESSPNRSPNHGQELHGQQSYDAQDSDKPLSLVIRKNLVSHFVQSESNNNNTFVPPKKKWRGEAEGRACHRDSGNEEEEEEEPALVIEEEKEEEEEDRVQEATVYDFSTGKKDTYNEGALEKKEKTTTGIKIADFARLSAAAVAAPKLDAAAPEEAEEEVESEGESDCGSVSSVDTWSSSLAEGKPFSGTDAVIRRVRSTSSGDPCYQCDFCDKLFANKYHLQSHLVTHTGERAFTCRTCNKTFGRKSTLRAHMTTHTKVSNFMCTICEKACNDNNSLEEHMRMHTGMC